MVSGIDGNAPPADRVTFRCELPADAAPGVYALRLATERGISNLRLVVVDDLPTLQAAGDNLSPAKAQPLELPVAVEGAIPAEGRHYYKFHAAPPQRLSVEVLAQHLGSPLDSQIRLLDERGEELASSDDDEATGSDSRLVHRFAAEGDYYLEIGDVRYLGGSDYRYRLRLGDFPLVTAPFPLGVQAAALARIEVTGTDLDELPAIEAPCAGQSRTNPDASFAREGHLSPRPGLRHGGAAWSGAALSRSKSSPTTGPKSPRRSTRPVPSVAGLPPTTTAIISGLR